MILVSSLVTGFISMRQVSLHLAPGDPGYGSALFGLHFYTWALIAAIGIVCYVALVFILKDVAGKRARGRAFERCGIEHGLRDLCVAGRRQSLVHRAGVRRGAVRRQPGSLSPAQVIGLKRPSCRNAIVCSIAAGCRSSPECDALTMMWSVMPASFPLATETLPSFGRGRIRNDEIGSIVRHARDDAEVIIDRRKGPRAQGPVAVDSCKPAGP